MDGLGLHNAFGGNSLSFSDPFGEEIDEAGVKILQSQINLLDLGPELTDARTKDILKALRGLVCTAGGELSVQLPYIKKLQALNYDGWLKGLFAGQKLLDATEMFYQLVQWKILNPKWEPEQHSLPQNSYTLTKTNCWGFYEYLIWITAKKNIDINFTKGGRYDGLGQIVAKAASLQSTKVSRGEFVFSLNEEQYQQKVTFTTGVYQGKNIDYAVIPFHIGLAINFNEMIHHNNTAYLFGGYNGVQNGNIAKELSGDNVVDKVFNIKAEPILWAQPLGLDISLWNY